MATLESQILHFITESSTKVTYTSLARHFRRTGQAPALMVKRAVAVLIASGELCYTSDYGRSFIEPSFNRPYRVSEHIILAPPNRIVEASMAERVIRLERGASFGGGDHPTTRAAIALIDKILHARYWQEKKSHLRALDIGTGSGVLAIVAAKLGVGSVLGVDIDPCSIHEARGNVGLNHLDDRVVIHEPEAKGVLESFDLIVANLRTPSLMGLREEVDRKANSRSALVFSGMRTEETAAVEACYQEMGFKRTEKRSEKGWSAICLIRGFF